MASLAVPVASPARAAPVERASEESIKAAYLFNFGSYVEWPEGALADAESPLRFGVIRAERVAQALVDVVAERRVQGHPVEIIRLEEADATAGCQVLFVGRDVGLRLTSVLDSARMRGVLVVTESDGALDLGSAINFVVVDGRVRFDVALAAAEAAELKLSSRLLAVARHVLSEDP